MVEELPSRLTKYKGGRASGEEAQRKLCKGQRFSKSFWRQRLACPLRREALLPDRLEKQDLDRDSGRLSITS